MLLLMNINGCLIHRTSERIEFVKHDESEKYKKHVKMFKQKKFQYVYYRDSYLWFLREIMQHPRVNFGFYSAIMQKNIVGILLKTFEEDLALYHENMFGIFDQNYCNPDPKITKEKYGFTKDLNKVWQSQLIDGKFDETNTMLLESDEVSVHHCYENALIIDRFERSDVWPEPDEEYRDQAAILKAIRDDIFALLDKNTTDIREVLESMEFSEFLRKAKPQILQQDEEPEEELVQKLNDLNLK
jgi:hypothetical protein